MFPVVYVNELIIKHENNMKCRKKKQFSKRNALSIMLKKNISKINTQPFKHFRNQILQLLMGLLKFF